MYYKNICKMSFIMNIINIRGNTLIFIIYCKKKGDAY